MSARPFAGYLFDLDGTLVDTAPDIHTALNVALKQHNLKSATEEHTRHWIGHGATALIEQALEQELAKPASTALVDQVRSSFLAYYQDHIADHSRAYPDVVETLGELQRRGAGLAVVTNKISHLTHHLLKTMQLTGHFTSIVCGDTTANAKPAADPVLHACAELQLNVADVLFVGDSAADVGSARAAGCAVVCVRDGYNHGIPATQLGADAVIESFLDLVGLELP